MSNSKTVLYFGVLIVYSTLIAFGFSRISAQIVIEADQISSNLPVISTGRETIFIYTPISGSAVKSPVLVSGRARGTWYFEASFPVRVTDEDGQILGQGPATALSDWMTVDFVEFESEIEFDKGSATRGFVVFEEDDPSGMGNVETRRIPVNFE